MAYQFINDQDHALAAVGPIHELPDYNWIRRRSFWLRCVTLRVGGVAFSPLGSTTGRGTGCSRAGVPQALDSIRESGIAGFIGCQVMAATMVWNEWHGLTRSAFLFL